MKNVLQHALRRFLRWKMVRPMLLSQMSALVVKPVLKFAQRMQSQ